VAWTFSGTFLDGAETDRVTVADGAPRPLAGRYALASPAAGAARGTRVR